MHLKDHRNHADLVLNLDNGGTSNNNYYVDEKVHLLPSAGGNRIASTLRWILNDKNSRNMLLFLLLNSSFAFVELFYGIWTNSLGLISDAFHMFFDCTGLIAGLIATVVASKKPTPKFSYGYGRAEVVGGLVNGLLLMFVAFFILSEAVERAFEPPQVKHERLFVVSVLGFLVNLVGIYAFQHAHSHGHGHSHGGGGHDHGHSHGHNHSHDGEKGELLMKGVFLHILADTLGSVGVIVSSILIWAFNWLIADPICSIFIAVLISMSVFPLIKDCIEIVMQSAGGQHDKLPMVERRLMELESVCSVQNLHLWRLNSESTICTVKLEVESRDEKSKSEFQYLNIQATQILKSMLGATETNVQIDFQQVY